MSFLDKTEADTNQDVELLFMSKIFTKRWSWVSSRRLRTLTLSNSGLRFSVEI